MGHRLHATHIKEKLVKMMTPWVRHGVNTCQHGCARRTYAYHRGVFLGKICVCTYRIWLTSLPGRMLFSVLRGVRPVLRQRSPSTSAELCTMTVQNDVYRKPFNDHLQSLGTTIFSVMTAMSVQYNSVNLGQVRRSGDTITC